MKQITGITTTFLITILLTACGGGGSDGATTPSTPSTPDTQSDSGTLIIDNGRGTTNNQDTEKAN